MWRVREGGEMSMTRVITIEASGVVSREVVTVGMPVFHEDAQSWSCSVHLPRVMIRGINVAGDDAIGALIQAVDLIRALVKSHERIGWRFSWLVDGDGGFPSFEED